MYNDQYFPKPLVDKVKQVLIEFSYDIETKKPKNEKELYKLSYKATIRINNLAREFEENGSEIETVARDTIWVDFEFIAKSYWYNNIDVEELIAPREW